MSVRGASARVGVADEGLGIDPEQRDQLFRPFGRMVTTARPRFGGAGLGLYLARELTRLQGGDIAVESVSGPGRIFALSMPLAATQAMVPDAKGLAGVPDLSK